MRYGPVPGPYASVLADGHLPCQRERAPYHHFGTVVATTGHHRNDTKDTKDLAVFGLPWLTFP